MDIIYSIQCPKKNVELKKLFVVEIKMNKPGNSRLNLTNFQLTRRSKIIDVIMRKIALLLIISLISIQYCFTQSSKKDSVFYYYKGEKVFLSLNKKSLVVYYEKDVLLDSIIQRKYKSINIEGHYNFDSGLTSEAAVVVIDEDDDYSRELEFLKSLEKVKAVEIVIGDLKLIPMSNHFSVKLNDISDTILLKKIANETKTTILGPIPYCKNWYELEADKNSIADCLGVANIFVESNYFEKVDPGFILEFRTDCLTDNSYDLQWALNHEEVNINACGAWEISTGDNNVILAIIDGGVDVDHDEFINTNFAESYDVLRNTNLVRYPNPHATGVCGIISSSHNLDEIAGIAPGISIMDVDADLGGYNYDNRIAIGINWAVTNGADVINNSWNIYTTLPITSIVIEDAIDNAIENGRGGLGCVVVFSSGNASLFKSVKYPANYREEILCVGSVYYNKKKSSSSCYGEELDIVAPGEGILTTSSNNSYTDDDVYGTSFAAAYASGVAGLILSRNSHLSNDQVIDLIESSAQKIGDYSYQTKDDRTNGTWHEKMGYGVLDAEAALLPCLPTTIADMTFSSTIKEIRACGKVEIHDVAVENNGGFSILSHDGVTINSPFVVEVGSQITIY